MAAAPKPFVIALAAAVGLLANWLFTAIPLA
jgi:hypothetical protein